jgi:hypothetical protein
MNLATEMWLLGCNVLFFLHGSKEALNIFFRDDLIIDDKCLKREKKNYTPD